MAKRSDEASGIERLHSSDEEEEANLPFFARMKNNLTKFGNSIRTYIYNPQQHTIFGNTSSFWIKISVYYAIFYVCLGLFYSGMVAVFGAIISREIPTYTYRNSEMNDGGKVYIGMGFRPMPDITDTSITVYSDEASQKEMVSSLNLYRLVFLTQADSRYVEECSPTKPASELQPTHSCQFSWSDIVTSETHPCSELNRYGWREGKPCILVKLNKIYGWQPAPGDFVSDVEKAINDTILPIDKRESNIYITCNGTEQADEEARGNMMYYSLLHPLGHPSYGGIPYYFFPYLNSNEHVQPFVLVQFTSLPYDRLVDIQCRAWAPNIQQSAEGVQRRGMATFNLYRSNQIAP